MSWMSPLTVPITILPMGSAPVSAEQRAENRHAGFHRVRREEHFGHEQDPVAKVDADDAHGLDQRFVEDLVGSPTAPEQQVGAFHDLGPEPVVEIVVHLRDEIVIVKSGEINLFISFVGVDDRRVGHALPPRHRYDVCRAPPSRSPVPHLAWSPAEGLFHLALVPHSGTVPQNGTAVRYHVPCANVYIRRHRAGLNRSRRPAALSSD